MSLFEVPNLVDDVEKVIRLKMLKLSEGCCRHLTKKRISCNSSQYIRGSISSLIIVTDGLCIVGGNVFSCSPLYFFKCDNIGYQVRSPELGIVG